MKSILAWFGLAFCAACALTASAAEPARNPNRFNLSGKLTFLIDADFTSVTPTLNIGPPGPAPTVPAVDRFYDDGFVRVDVSGNAGSTTWFYGYNDPSQITAFGTPAGTLSLHSAPSPADQFTRDNRLSTQFGANLGYDRDLGSFKLGRNTEAFWGIGASFGYSALRLRDFGTVNGLVPLTTDTYAIGPTPVLPAPFAGTSAGPFPLIPDTPAARATVATPATATLLNQIDGDLYGFTLGPFVEFPFGDGFALKLDCGVAVAVADRAYNFSETVAVTGVPATTRSGTVNSIDWLVGGTVGAGLTMPITERLTAQLALQYQYLGTTSQSVAGKTARLDLRTPLSAMVGLNWRF